MSDDTLISLDDFEEPNLLYETDSENAPIKFNILIVERELILICSLVLRAASIFIIEDDSWEKIHAKVQLLQKLLFEHTALYLQHYGIGTKDWGSAVPIYLGEEQLPDVCGRCFRTVGFCAGGGLRYRCRECYGKEAHVSSLQSSDKRNSYLWRFNDNSLVSAILAQLIYKYHSPNGDRTWAMKTLLS